MAHSSIRFRSPTLADIATLSSLLEQSSITIGGLGDGPFLRAVVADAANGGPVNIVVAESDGEIIGWSIAVIDARRYWRRFIIRHPVLGMRILRERLRRKHTCVPEPLQTSEESGKNVDLKWEHRSAVAWGTSRPSTAKHIDITIAEPFRSCGIGRRLQVAHLESLKQNGVLRVDAVISKKNLPSIRFHINQAWSYVREDEERLYITKESDTYTAARASDRLAWKHNDVIFPFSVGEVRLFSVKFGGIRSDPDIFTVPKLCLVEPPISNLTEAAVRCAYVYSCPLMRRLPTFSVLRGYIRYVGAQYRHYYVRIDGKFRDYLSRFKKKTLSTLRRKVTKAEHSNRHRECFVSYLRPEKMDEFFELAIRVSKVSYQDILLRQGLPNDVEFREHVKREAANGRIRGFVLFVEDSPAAYNLCPIYGDGIMLYGHTGYDPKYSRYSPGTVLQYKIIESLHEEGALKHYDLCTGEGRHKELFATEDILCANVYFLSFAPHHVACVCSQILLRMVTSVGKGVLARFGLKEKLKKLIRLRWR